jgi:hypothetical protein
MANRSHDLEFHVGYENSTDATIFHDFDKAAGHAVAQCCGTGSTMVIDVVTWTKAAARKWGGESAVEVYESDPEASVHERIVIKAEALGHVP